jgi:hypothetical protein
VQRTARFVEKGNPIQSQKVQRTARFVEKGNPIQDYNPPQDL